MNDKFFDLKKEKQDRMINAAIKIFALNGYKHSSTDDIVKEAGISKGLLFHYFGSKIRLYEFLYDYCVRFLTLELSGTIPRDEKDYFNIIEFFETAKVKVLRTYPYLQMFIDKSKFEDDEEAVHVTADLRDDLQSTYDSFLERVDVAAFNKNTDPACVNNMLQAAFASEMNEELLEGIFDPDKYYKECIKYIKMMRSICY